MTRRGSSPASERKAARSRRLWIGLIGGLAALLAAPLLGSHALEQETLGTSTVSRPIAILAPAAGDPSTVAAPRAIPDPAGDRSTPGMRLPPPVESLTGYRWPIRNAHISQGFGPSPWGLGIVDGKTFHDGLDLATHCGDQIRAAHAGTVLAASRRFDAYLGWVGDLTAYTGRLDEKHLWMTLPIVIVIDDGNGYRSIYAHLRSVVVKPGDVVAAGDLIGAEGATGRASGCHLHYGLFSPYTPLMFGFDPVAAAHMRLPTQELARIDPLLVLPPGVEAGIH